MAALYTRCSFGMRDEASPGNNEMERYANFENSIGAQGRLRRFSIFYDMVYRNGSGWPTSQANWCASTNHDLDIAWDMLNYGGTFAGLIAGDNNATLDAFAQECKRFPHTVILRMWWEMNIPPGPTKVGTFGVANGSNLWNTNDKATRIQQWVAAWRYVYNRIKVVNGVTNVRFFWCPNGSDSGQGAHATGTDLWPGDAYVDEIGFNTYEESTYEGWHGFDGRMAGPMSNLAGWTGNSQKPISIGELGSEASFAGGQTREQFVRGMFLSELWPRLKHIAWYNTPFWGLDSASIALYRQYVPLSPPDATSGTGVIIIDNPPPQNTLTAVGDDFNSGVTIIQPEQPPSGSSSVGDDFNVVGVPITTGTQRFRYHNGTLWATARVRAYINGSWRVVNTGETQSVPTRPSTMRAEISTTPTAAYTDASTQIQLRWFVPTTDELNGYTVEGYQFGYVTTDPREVAANEAVYNSIVYAPAVAPNPFVFSTLVPDAVYDVYVEAKLVEQALNAFIVVTPSTNYTDPSTQIQIGFVPPTSLALAGLTVLGYKFGWTSDDPRSYESGVRSWESVVYAPADVANPFVFTSLLTDATYDVYVEAILTEGA